MPRLIVEFSKMNGAGNDFVVIDNRFYHFSDEELIAMARRYCPRRVGIGADGILALNHAVGDADFRMRYINADGSVGTMCGNGARCLAFFARAAGIDGEPLRFETDAGMHRAWIDRDRGRVKIDMVAPRDYRASVDVCGDLPEAAFLWTGTEHAVVAVDDVDRADVDLLGRRLRRDPAFDPTGANVNFVERSGPSSLRVRTFEKGVEAETLACGTGAVASAVVSVMRGIADGPEVTVTMPGGALNIGLTRGDDGEVRAVTLEGPVETVYRGSFEW
jgi:diaminopimelate epimerase